MKRTYDYIIAGAGCAGLSFAVHLISSGQFTDKKILLIDRKEHRENDRTWCFWEKEAGLFEQAVSKSWEHLYFFGNSFSSLIDIQPYAYKLIRGIDFYTYALALIDKEKNFEWHFGEILGLSSEKEGATIETAEGTFSADYIFSSLHPFKAAPQKNEVTLQQHFKGYVVQAAEGSFQADKATLMDFRIAQKGETAFMYILPFTSCTALVEYTVFGKDIWESSAYDEQLHTYLDGKLGSQKWKILETELGSIPMSTRSAPASTSTLIPLGIAGGQTKASTGYTFKFIQYHSQALVAALIASGKPVLKTSVLRSRFKFYDNVLLRVLARYPDSGAAVFGRMFKNNNAVSVLRFLDNSSGLWEELRLTLSLQKKWFLSAAVYELMNKFNSRKKKAGLLFP